MTLLLEFSKVEVVFEWTQYFMTPMETMALVKVISVPIHTEGHILLLVRISEQMRHEDRRPLSWSCDFLVNI